MAAKRARPEDRPPTPAEEERAIRIILEEQRRQPSLWSRLSEPAVTAALIGGGAALLAPQLAPRAAPAPPVNVVIEGTARSGVQRFEVIPSKDGEPPRVRARTAEERRHSEAQRRAGVDASAAFGGGAGGSADRLRELIEESWSSWPTLAGSPGIRKDRLNALFNSPQSGDAAAAMLAIRMQRKPYTELQEIARRKGLRTAKRSRAALTSELLSKLVEEAADEHRTPHLPSLTAWERLDGIVGPSDEPV